MNTPIKSALSLSRRQFVQGLAVGGVLAGFPGLLQAESQSMALTRTGSAALLSGREVNLVIAQSPVNFTGVVRMATTINGSIPAPTLRFREGDEVTIRVTNQLSVSSSIHWHGILLPYQMDGVPGLSYQGIAPGETFVYRFKLRQSGTYWYHSHSGFQEMTGMYGALIVEPLEGESIRADSDHIIQLSDWTDEDPMRVFAKLKSQSDVYNFNLPTAGDFLRDAAATSVGAAMDKRRMWDQMRMNPTDLADLSAATLTYLMNGGTPAANWTGEFKRGDCVRLRFINSASNSLFDVRIPGLTMRVVQADGQNVEPVAVDEFRFGPGETYDVLVEPSDDAYTIFAQSMDRTGYARGTLALKQGLKAPVPALDKPEWLSMTDMMGSMSKGHDMASMSGMAGMSMEHDMADMKHGGMIMDHQMHDKHQNPLQIPSQKVRHASSEYGPSVDARVDTPRTNLDDPGVGLRNNGRRVLSLADLHSIGGAKDKRIPEREIELHLTGNMERYSWSFDGLEFGKSTPISMNQGERVRVILQNDTMMTHPMHLHGMWSDLENDHGEFQVRRHTILVQPAQRISFLTTPDDVGRWAWHCHLLFHMDAGMFREVLVS